MYIYCRLALLSAWENVSTKEHQFFPGQFELSTETTQGSSGVDTAEQQLISQRHAVVPDIWHTKRQPRKD